MLVRHLRWIRRLAVPEFESQKAGAASVSARDVDALISEETILAALAAEPQGQGLHVVGPHLSFEPYAILLRKGDREFEKVVDKVLSDAFASREGLRLFDKWFTSEGGIRIPLNQNIRDVLHVPKQVRGLS